MRVSLCLFGNVGHKSSASTRKDNDVTAESKTASTDPSIGYQHYKKALFDHYDVDVFIHSWSEGYRHQLLKLYDPIAHEIMEQKMFDIDLNDYGINASDDIEEWEISDSAKFGYKALLPSRHTVQEIKREMGRLAFRIQSRWWSTKRVLELKKQHEEANRFKYDLVFEGRLDCKFYKKIELENINPKLFYATPRTGRIDFDYALHDFWFMSGTENMDKFASIYDHLTEYCIRPTVACREHINKVIGDENLSFMLTHERDYSKP